MYPRAACVGLTLLALTCIPPATAASLLDASVTRDEKVFSVEFSIRVNATAQRLQTLLEDYTALARLSPSTLSSELIAPGAAPNTGSTPWVSVTMRPCILIFCKTLRKLSAIVPERNGVTRYDSVPGRDDFSFARERLSIQSDAGSPETHTILTYTASLEPAFYVPPILGPWIVRRVVIREMLTAATRAEQVIASGERAPRP